MYASGEKNRPGPEKLARSVLQLKTQQKFLAVPNGSRTIYEGQTVYAVILAIITRIQREPCLLTNNHGSCSNLLAYDYYV